MFARIPNATSGFMREDLAYTQGNPKLNGMSTESFHLDDMSGHVVLSSVTSLVIHPLPNFQATLP
jgi:hypothetical protein